jgi:glutathione synthase/RimK-type ligase-like ATP-grasp enzyme
MPQKLLFIGRRDDREEYDTAQSMAQQMQAVSDDFSYAACSIEDIVFTYDGTALSITDAASGTAIGDYDVIFLLGWFKLKMFEDVVLAVARYAEARGIPLYNSEALYNRSHTKLSQYVIAAMHDLHAMPFAFAADSTHLLSNWRQAGFDFPLIAKHVMASRGRDNYLVRSEDELRQIFTDNPTLPFVLQPFIPNDGDYRLVVMGDAVRFAMLRKGQEGSHLNNTSQGGDASAVAVHELDPAMCASAVAIAAQLRREVTGVDMVQHKETGAYYFLEANNMPQLSTGSLVPLKMQALAAYLAEGNKHD